MKKDIHPTWYPEAKVTCACGHTFTVGSTRAEIQVEICAKCHPFFTGENRFVDVQGRVEKFQEKQKTAQKANFVTKTERKRLKRLAEEKEAEKTPKTLKEMLSGAGSE